MISVDKRLEESVADSIEAMETTDRDQALIHLAITYARAIDQLPEDIGRMGPQLLACLEALLMTPRARQTAMKGTNGVEHKQFSPLDELRQRRRAM